MTRAAPVAREDEVEPPRAEPARPLERDLAVGAPRPEIVATRRVDAARLPLARWDQPDPKSRVRVQMSPSGATAFLVDGVRFAELTVDGAFGAFTGQDFVTGNPPACGSIQKPGRAGWRGFLQKRWTDTGFDVVMSRGSFDFKTCTAAPDTTLKGRAVALVDGWVYAIRILDAGAPLLWIATPHATLASVTADDATSGSFSMASIPLEPHRSSTATFRISPAALTAWSRMRHGGEVTFKTESTSDAMLLSIDVEAGAGEESTIAVSAALPHPARPAEYAAIVAAIRGAG